MTGHHQQKTDNRPEFQHMMKDGAKSLLNVALVWKLDCFARNRYDTARYKNLLEKNGMKVTSARENISEGSQGIILEAMLKGHAEYYSAKLSEKVIRGLTDNALNVNTAAELFQWNAILENNSIVKSTKRLPRWHSGNVYEV